MVIRTRDAATSPVLCFPHPTWLYFQRVQPGFRTVNLGVDSPEHTVYSFRYVSKPCMMDVPLGRSDNLCNFGEAVSRFFCECGVDGDDSDMAVTDMTL